MASEQDTGRRAPHGRLLPLALVAPIVGAMTGLVCAIFRITLDHADRLRDTLITWAHGHALVGFLILVAVCATAAAIAAFLVRAISPHAAGSGIPHAEAVLRGQLEPAPYTLVPVKFVGGILAIGSGLALGREGPSVQMGASIAFLTGRLCRMSWSDCRVLLAAGAGAGLATAFNAPIAGAIFVLEELVQRFEHRVAIRGARRLGNGNRGGAPVHRQCARLPRRTRQLCASGIAAIVPCTWCDRGPHCGRL